MDTLDAFDVSIAPHDVIFARGACERVGTLIERRGWQRVLLCTTPSARGRGQIAPIAAALGERLVATYEGVRPHVPDTSVAEATALAVQARPDAIIGLGGGSPIGTAKAVSHALSEQQAGGDALPIIAIPTTYAGSEMTPVFGVTHHGDGPARKITVSDARIAPRLVIYDPLLTLDLPPQMTAGTGINAVAHCIEALYSTTRNPLSTAAALGGLRAFARALRRCYDDGSDLAARTEMLAGAFLAGTALASVAMALHHGICHVLGGTTGVAHGDVNCVMLSHAMRFNLPATAPELAEAAAALGVARAGQSAQAAAEDAIEYVDGLVAALHQPYRLRDLGIGPPQLPDLARLAFASKTVRNNPRPITDAGQIEALLRAAW